MGIEASLVDDYGDHGICQSTATMRTILLSTPTYVRSVISMSGETRLPVEEKRGRLKDILTQVLRFVKRLDHLSITYRGWLRIGVKDVVPVFIL